MTQAPIFSDNGDIYVHGRDEPSFRVTFDATYDPTGRLIVMEILGVSRRVLQNDGTAGVLLTILEEDLAKIPSRGTQYVVRDETEAQADVLLDGNIRWHGWVE